jgi:hypothetical protein
MKSKILVYFILSALFFSCGKSGGTDKKKPSKKIDETPTHGDDLPTLPDYPRIDVESHPVYLRFKDEGIKVLFQVAEDQKDAEQGLEVLDEVFDELIARKSSFDTIIIGSGYDYKAEGYLTPDTALAQRVSLYVKARESAETIRTFLPLFDMLLALQSELNVTIDLYGPSIEFVEKDLKAVERYKAQFAAHKEQIEKIGFSYNGSDYYPSTKTFHLNPDDVEKNVLAKFEIVDLITNLSAAWDDVEFRDDAFEPQAFAKILKALTATTAKLTPYKAMLRRVVVKGGSSLDDADYYYFEEQKELKVSNTMSDEEISAMVDVLVQHGATQSYIGVPIIPRYSTYFRYSDYVSQLDILKDDIKAKKPLFDSVKTGDSAPCEVKDRVLYISFVIIVEQVRTCLAALN